jgi:hypothetical protein
MIKTILCPFIGENEYDDETQLEMNDIYPYYKQWGCTDFALLDACSLEYYGKIELH